MTSSGGVRLRRMMFQFLLIPNGKESVRELPACGNSLSSLFRKSIRSHKLGQHLLAVFRRRMHPRPDLRSLSEYKLNVSNDTPMCLSLLLLPGAGLEETEYHSRRLGVTTIATESRSTTMRPYSSNQSMMINNTSRGHTEGQSQRSLQTADELRTMKKGTLLFVHASSPAAMLKTTAYFENRKLKQLADLPFELDLPWEYMYGQDQEVEVVEEDTIVIEPWTSLVRGTEGQEDEEIPLAPDERS